MRRWFTIFLLILLPFQFTWAAAAVYCQHEKSATARHIGHHEHEHKAHSDAKSQAKQADGKEAVKDAKLLLDDDCGFCQLSAAKPVAAKPLDLPLISTGASVQPPAPWLATRDPDRLERPNWRPA